MRGDVRQLSPQPAARVQLLFSPSPKPATEEPRTESVGNSPRAPCTPACHHNILLLGTYARREARTEISRTDNVMA